MDNNQNNSGQNPPTTSPQDTPLTTAVPQEDTPPTIAEDKPATPEAPTTPSEQTAQPTMQTDESTVSPDSPVMASATPPSLGPNNKKTVAIAAAGISAILIVLGVYAMTKENFKTNTNQYAASKETQSAEPTAPIQAVGNQDPIERDLNAAEDEMKKADEDTSTVDTSLQTTPDPLN